MARSFPPTPDPVPPGGSVFPIGPAVTVASRQGPFTVVSLVGRLTAASAVTAQAELLSTIVLSPPPLHLVLDLTGLTSGLDPVGVGLLSKTRFAVRAACGTLRLVVPARGEVGALLARLEPGIPCYDMLSQALAAPPNEPGSRRPSLVRS